MFTENKSPREKTSASPRFFHSGFISRKHSELSMYSISTVHLYSKTCNKFVISCTRRRKTSPSSCTALRWLAGGWHYCILWFSAENLLACHCCCRVLSLYATNSQRTVFVTSVLAQHDFPVHCKFGHSVWTRS